MNATGAKMRGKSPAKTETRPADNDEIVRGTENKNNPNINNAKLDPRIVKCGNTR